MSSWLTYVAEYVLMCCKWKDLEGWEGLATVCGSWSVPGLAGLERLGCGREGCEPRKCKICATRGWRCNGRCNPLRVPGGIFGPNRPSAGSKIFAKLLQVFCKCFAKFLQKTMVFAKILQKP